MAVGAGALGQSRGYHSRGQLTRHMEALKGLADTVATVFVGSVFYYTYRGRLRAWKSSRDSTPADASGLRPIRIEKWFCLPPSSL